MIFLPFICILLVNQCNAKLYNNRRIISGHLARPKQFPHHVAIYILGRFNCGGSIIGPRKVLTAGHCVCRHSGLLFPIRYIKVRGGGTDTDQLEFEFIVDRVELHPDYEAGLIKADLSMLFLRNDVPLNLFKSVDLQKKSVPYHTSCIIVGWGQNLRSTGSQLLYGNVRIDDKEKCYEEYHTTDLKIICAGYHDLSSPCSGDSSGSLLCNNLATGIVSYGSSKCTLGKPAVYGNISLYLDWIHSNRGNLRCFDRHGYILYLILLSKILLL